MTELLLSDPHSALSGPAYAEELYELARGALFALGPDKSVGRQPQTAGDAQWIS